MEGLIKLLPYSYIMMLIGSLALMGIPFLTGFYSKDVIIEITYISYIIDSSFIYWLSVIAALFTSLYSIRLLVYVFITSPNGYRKMFELIHESNIFMSLPLFILALNSIFFGYINKDLFIGLGNDTWLNWLNIISTRNILILESEFLPWYIKNIPFFFSMSGIIIIFLINYYYTYLYKVLRSNNYLYFKRYNNIASFFSYKWYVDTIYNKIILGGFIKLSYIVFKNIDRGIIELIGPLGLVRLWNSLSINYKYFFPTGYIFNYLFLFIISSVSLIIFYILPINNLNSELLFILIAIILINKYKNK